MLSVLLLSIVPLVAYGDGGDGVRDAAELEMVARLGESRLRAHNASERPLLLVLGELGGALRARTWIAPGTGLDTRFPPGSLAGLALEVVSFGPHGPSSSGALPLEVIAAASYDAFWVETSELGSQAWGKSGQVVSAIEPNDLQLASLALSAAAPRATQPAHVPVVTPADRKNGALPPRLEKKPLPPI
jgi:hypothetical protein